MTHSEALDALRRIAKLPASENGGKPWPAIDYTQPAKPEKLRMFNWRVM